MTEKKISYVRRLNPDRANQVPAVGSAFAANANVPALLRGPATGFTVCALIRASGGFDYLVGGASVAAQPENELVAGSRDFDNDLGWLLSMDEGRIITFDVGDGQLTSSRFTSNVDLVVAAVCDIPNDSYTLIVNGNDVSAGGGIVYGQGPANFGIGTSLDASFTVLRWDPADSGGIWNTGLAGLWLTPDLMTADEYTAMYEASLYSANLVPVATGVDQTVKGNHFNARDIATYGDATTQWVDSIGAFALPRVGAPLTGEVIGRQPNFFAG